MVIGRNLGICFGLIVRSMGWRRASLPDEPAGQRRLSHADRDHFAGVLGRHYAAGPPDIDDLSDRLARVSAAAAGTTGQLTRPLR